MFTLSLGGSSNRTRSHLPLSSVTPMTNLESTTSEVQYSVHRLHRYSKNRASILSVQSPKSQVSLKVSLFQTKLSCWLSWRLKLAQQEKYFTLLLSQLHGSPHSIYCILRHWFPHLSFILYEKPGFGSVHFRRKGTQQRSSSNTAEPQEHLEL